MTHTHLTHGASTYHAGGHGQHIHLVCHRCEAVAEADTALALDLASAVTDRYGFRADLSHLSLHGLCRACAASGRRRSMISPRSTCPVRSPHPPTRPSARPPTGPRALLSGAPLEAGGGIRSGTSIDQVLAQQYGQTTKVPSLVLGCEKANPSVHKNYSMLYSSHISWSSPTTPTPLEVFPSLAFDRLFRDEATKADKSVLDAVLEDANDLRRKNSARDQQKLDEYLSSVREVEQRISRAGQLGEYRGWRPSLDKPNIPRPADGIPQDIAEHMRLMCDILVLAFQTDATRICTLKLNNDHPSLRFPNLGVDYMIHHLLSHQESEDWLKVNRFFLEQLAYIAQKLDAVQEGERTALDNSAIMYCSSMLTGSHDATKLPVVILGRAGGKLETGRVLDYLDKPNRKMCSLYLSLMEKFGIEKTTFGDSTERLSDV